jgi:hypothetical protein
MWIVLVLGGRALGPGFGNEIEAAKTRRLEFLESEGLAQRHGDRFVLSRNLLGTLRERDLAAAGASISRGQSLPYRQGRPNGDVSGIYRERIQLASGRFAMIDDASALTSLVRQLDGREGQYVSGTRRDRVDARQESIDRNLIAPDMRVWDDLDNRTI